MTDVLDLGSAPTDESCAQVGSRNYIERARKECRAYIAQLRRVFGPEPPAARLSTKSNPHDFGTYYSVVCHFDPDDRASIDYAYRCEREGPAEWDDEARRELGLDDSRKEAM